MTKKNRSILTSYLMSDKRNLNDAYASYSTKKAAAWEYCKELCKEKNGRCLKVIGANSNFFSAGFLYEEDGFEKLMYITHGGDYPITIDEQ